MNKHDTPVLNPENALKLGVFAINLRGGVTLADVDANNAIHCNGYPPQPCGDTLREERSARIHRRPALCVGRTKIRGAHTESRPPPHRFVKSQYAPAGARRRGNIIGGWPSTPVACWRRA
jgi:hypothetical protein